ncbi:MAG: hypothetical protein QY314_03965 [Candidatus Dojkabacteria bacterium]|nr:MAG: hypothetical protein QY314_03965 [Candidatus Dojkabacteria bacterium]
MTHIEIVKHLQNIVSQKSEKWKEVLSMKMLPEGVSQDQAFRASAKSDFAGITEGTETFYALLDLANEYQQTVRDGIREEIQANRLQLTPFETILVMYSLEISFHYAAYYKAWIQEMVSSPASQFLKAELETNPDKLHSFITEKGFDNGYTVITHNSEENVSYETLQQIPYAEKFAQELDPILRDFDNLFAATQHMTLNEEEQAMVTYLKHYRGALALTSIEELEQAWTEVDKYWMNTSFWIQIVHDIENHYGDPLGVKIIPDFSLRFTDESHEQAQASFKASQQILDAYYSVRDNEFSKKGLQALRNSLACVSYLPFQTGMSVHFKFAGQSIPNRTEVKQEKGVKIYLDYQSSQARTEKAKQLFKKVFGDGVEKELQYVTAEDQMLNHVVPHEFGHTIYNIGDFAPAIPNVYSQQLEELRADLNALSALHILDKNGQLSPEKLHETVVGYTAHELRRYDAWTSSSLRAYRNSTMRIYSLLAEAGILNVENDSVTLAFSTEKESQFLKLCFELLDKIHDALEVSDTSVLETVLQEIKKSEESDYSKIILSKLKS